MEERIFYSDADVLISNEAVKSGMNAYPLQEVKSVKLRARIAQVKKDWRWWVGWGSWAASLLWLLSFFLFGFGLGQILGYPLQSLVVIVLSIGMIKFGLPLIERQFQYSVILEGDFGQVDLHLIKNQRSAIDIRKAFKAAKKQHASPA